MTKQVMQRALDALEDLKRQYSEHPDAFWDWAKGRDAIAELQTAIAAPEVEPVGCVAKDGFTILYFQSNALPFETDLYTASPDTEALRKELDDALKDRVALAMELEAVKASLRLCVDRLRFVESREAKV